jgi:uncharacterized protein (TIGR00730 family)
MHERKALMYDLSDGFAALPGGIGTLDELFEIYTWGQLGYHGKPVGILNTAGYYDNLLVFLDNMTKEKFLRPEHRQNLLVGKDPEILLEKMMTMKPKVLEKWH